MGGVSSQAGLASFRIQLGGPAPCPHPFTRPAAVDDPRPRCTDCLAVLTEEN